MRALAIAAIAALGMAISVGAADAQQTKKTAKVSADAWSESNCRKLCDLTVPVGTSPSSCYARIPCSKFRGKPSAPDSRVQARARTYCQQYGRCAAR